MFGIRRAHKVWVQFKVINPGGDKDAGKLNTSRCRHQNRLLETKRTNRFPPQVQPHSSYCNKLKGFELSFMLPPTWWSVFLLPWQKTPKQESGKRSSSQLTTIGLIPFYLMPKNNSTNQFIILVNIKVWERPHTTWPMTSQKPWYASKIGQLFQKSCRKGRVFVTSRSHLVCESSL